jgi:hypothetical protein
MALKLVIICVVVDVVVVISVVCTKEIWEGGVHFNAKH